MAARFWVTGGTGNWNSTTNWSATSGGASGASVPGSADTAALDASSGSGTVTLDISPTIQTLTCTGFTGTLAFGTNTISLNSTGTIFTGATTMTVTGTPQIICTNSSATARTITPTASTEANSISFRVTAGTGGLTFTAGSYRDLDFTDGATSAGFGGTWNNSIITIYGSLKLSTSGMTVPDAAGTLTFAATSGTKTINSNGVVVSRPFTFNGIGGTFQLASALTSGATRTATLTNGTLDLASYTLTTGQFSSNQSNVRTLAFGTGKIVLTGSAATVFTTLTATNLTVTGTSPLIQLTTNATTGTRVVNIGASGESNAISVDVTAGSDQVNFGSTNGAYRDVNFTGFTGTYNAANSIFVFGNWNFGGTTAVSGTATPSFAATSGTKTITSNGVSFPANITFTGIGGTWSLQDALTINSTSTIALTAGTIASNGYTITTGFFSSTGSSNRALSLNNGVISLSSTGTAWTTSGTNFSMGATDRISLSSSTTQTLSGGGVNLGTVSIDNSAAKTITGSNSFYNIVNTVVPATVNFEATSTNTFSNFNLNGATGSLVSLRSTISGTRYNLVKI